MTPEQIEAAAKAIYDNMLSYPGQLDLLVHEFYDADGKSLSEHSESVRAILASLARDALAAAEAKAWCADAPPRTGPILVQHDGWIEELRPCETWYENSVTKEREGGWCTREGYVCTPRVWRLPPAPPEAG